MATERTLSIIKPDATRRNLTGEVNARLEKAGLRIIAQKRLWLALGQAQSFYEVHKARPFYNDLCRFMTSGPVVVQVLEGENAVARNREVMRTVDHQTDALDDWNKVKDRIPADAAGLIGWDVSVDSTTARAHQHAAGARRDSGAQAEPPGSEPA